MQKIYWGIFLCRKMEREPVSAGTAVDPHAAPPCGEREGKEAGGRRFRLQGNSKKIWARLTAHP